MVVVQNAVYAREAILSCDSVVFVLIVSTGRVKFLYQTADSGIHAVQMDSQLLSHAINSPTLLIVLVVTKSWSSLLHLSSNTFFKLEETLLKILPIRFNVGDISFQALLVLCQLLNVRVGD